MKCKIINLDAKDVGEIDLADEIFSIPPRPDILQRMVTWQLAKRRAGTHKTKGISDVRGTGRKPWAQKGGGRARAGSLRSPQFRGGAVIFGPTPRSHAFQLPKKVRRLALKAALSAKQAAGKIVILDSTKLSSVKTQELKARFGKLGWSSVLVIDGQEVDANFGRAAHNLPGVDVLPQQGTNVYDILRRDLLVLTKDAIAYLEARLK
ncbi:MAG: 50S ribosomal protein L4 [Rhodospirillaceae bacterium]|nr:MAG: 50S ribosomal protein L4 [Rhodospirillaceae bacterium]